jgi:hypothetical protein
VKGIRFARGGAQCFPWITMAGMPRAALADRYRALGQGPWSAAICSDVRGASLSGILGFGVSSCRTLLEARATCAPESRHQGGGPALA